MTKELNPALDTLEGRIGRMAEIIDEMKGENIVVLDLRGLCDFTDAFIIVTMRSFTHMQAVTFNLLDKLREEGLKPIAKPDATSLRWTLIDYSNVIVHLFATEARSYYDLERLWADATSLTWQKAALA